jgi:hypothetical protein
MDDDDYYPPDRVSHAVERLTSSGYLLAGCSKCYIYDTANARLVVSGPFGPYHGLDCTFAYRRAYLDDHRYDDDAMVRTEPQFTNNFTSPMIQLEPRSTILMVKHFANTWDKRQTTVRPTRVRLRELVVDAADRRFLKRLAQASSAEKGAGYS